MAASFLEPGRTLDLLQIRRAQVEVPAVVAVAGLKANGRRHAHQGCVVEPPLFEVTIDGAPGQHGLGCAQQPVRGLDAVLLEKTDCLDGGQVAPLLVTGADLQCRDDFAEALEFGPGQYPRNATVRALQCLRPSTLAQRPVERAFRDSVQGRRLLHQHTSLGTPRGQVGEAPAQIDQSLGGELFALHARIRSARPGYEVGSAWRCRPIGTPRWRRYSYRVLLAMPSSSAISRTDRRCSRYRVSAA